MIRTDQAARALLAAHFTRNVRDDFTKGYAYGLAALASLDTRFQVYRIIWSGTMFSRWNIPTEFLPLREHSKWG